MRTDPDSLVTTLRPRYEGTNIGTWIGFKHLMYLAEEGLLAFFREQGFGPRRLFHEFGLGLEIVDASVQLPALLEIDDEVVAETRLLAPGRGSTRLRVEHGATPRVVLNGKLGFTLAANAQASGRPWPAELGALAPLDGAPQDGRLADVPLRSGDARAGLMAACPAAFYWCWKARYFHCHVSERVQYSAYVRALEEVVERFLEDRGLAVGRLLVERGLIPVVSRARVRMLRPVAMEALVHTTFVVDDVLMDKAYDGRMDCYVQHGGVLQHVASARILHGYAHSAGPEAGRLAALDAATLRALTGGTAP